MMGKLASMLVARAGSRDAAVVGFRFCKPGFQSLRFSASRMGRRNFQCDPGGVVGVSNPIETIVGILSLIDDVRAKMEGTHLAATPWRPVSPDSAEVLAELTREALARCDDVTEAVIVVVVAAVTVAAREAK